MKKYYFFVFLIPIIIVVSVNEFTRTTTNGYIRNGLKTINPYQKDVKKCSWYCHADTKHCKTNHTHCLKKHIKHIDTFYFGIIDLLKSTGNYRLANIIFLVILLPVLMLFLIIKSISIELKIRKFRNG